MTEPSHGAGNKPRQTVLVVSSHVVRGSVGNRALVFALEALGHPVWAVPTVVLPWHPGHGRATRIVPPARDLSALMSDLENAPWLGEVAAVISGYLGEAGQAEAIASLVTKLKSTNPAALYLCDPVMGEKDGLYVPEATATAIRDGLMPLADIATPNRYELAWMAGDALDTLDAVAAAASRAGPAAMLVTSAPAIVHGNIANLLVTPEGHHVAEHPVMEDPCKGTGDLMSALFLAWRLHGLDPAEALRRATAGVYEALLRAAERGADELMLETDAGVFSDPTVAVEVRSLAMPVG